MEQYISKDFADGPSVDAALKKALNAAPGGYGLGGYPKSIDSWDDALVNGWYMAPAPSGVGSGNIWGRVDCLSAAYLVQTVYADNYKNSARRFRIGSVFGEWEWIDPPMQTGVEYRTVERYIGKPVYQKLINFGALPSNSAKRVEHGIENFKLCASVQGTLGGYNLVGFGTPDMHVTGIYADGVSVRITTDGDFSSYASFNTYVLIKYTKSTD